MGASKKCCKKAQIDIINYVLESLCRAELTYKGRDFLKNLKFKIENGYNDK
jgi:hypothetical protein